MEKTKAIATLGFGAIKAKAHGEGTKVIKFGLQNYGMKMLLLFFALVISILDASAQKSVVLNAFSKYRIDAGILEANNIQQPENYAFDLKQTTITAGKEKTIVAKFDPSSPKEEQWTVITIDGKSPSKGDINSFRKNQPKKAASNKTDELSYKVEKEGPDYLVISYKPDPASVAKDAAFMKDCRLYMTINIKSRKLEQVQALNEKPLKIKILNAEKFDLILKYNWNDQANSYFTVSENLNMLAKFLGQPVSVQTISEYSNFAKK